ncbi:hypothetical protein N8529_00845, partial [bacterium]|nr:hypothetical protein [bacterium]
EGEDATSDLRKLLNGQTAGAKLKIRYARKTEGGRREFEAILELDEGEEMPRDLNEHQEEFERWKELEIGQWKKSR